MRTARLRRATQRLGQAAMRWMNTALTPVLDAPQPPARRTGQGLAEVARFGSNPGRLSMLVFHPKRQPPPGAPLILLLHGCRQDGAAFAMQSGWMALAERLSIPLVIPEQSAANNRHRCFRWYEPAQGGRGTGEAMSIRQMLRHACQGFGSDRRRVFIVGLSAGGAMAAAMLAAYPAVFAAGAVVAGLPVGAATTPAMAMLRMRRAAPFTTGPGLAAAARARANPRPGRPWPRLSIWQGEQDRVVDPANAGQLALQWAALHGCADPPATDEAPAPGLRHRVWRSGGRPVVELWMLESLAHGYPVSPGHGRAGPWMLEHGIPATMHIAAFWGLASE
ncbi:extracellular catalytic domain type 1 short-chain-length polyhydroxyalkanoate depolymerase [Sediminicoccus sp. BL-A-41-H5]|uniref:extracellular catalytic domain type 1 short-chain-length polyhydroxyalkanoate depolymerase n=1 Tax=Sediminicoccus sp. BL-A-41-H5 TaxID=3421106 RepID=UPI003D664A03